MLKFDDMKICRTKRNNILVLQNKLNKLVALSQECLMLLNAKNAKVMHIGKTNRRYIRICMNGQDIIFTSDVERDLGAYISIAMKGSSQCVFTYIHAFEVHDESAVDCACVIECIIIFVFTRSGVGKHDTQKRNSQVE